MNELDAPCRQWLADIYEVAVVRVTMNTEARRPINALVTKAHWETVSAGLSAVPSAGRPARRLPAWLYTAARSYDDYTLVRLFSAHLPHVRGHSVLEIGSAPGAYLVQFAATYGCQPYGVEYTADGAAVTRATFAAHGYDPQSVFEADVFSEPFLAAHREQFDVVLSRGFIEHFSELEPVISLHLALLKPGGTLIVSIPNLHGFNQAVFARVHPGSLTWHNLTIMDPDAFPALFHRPDLTPLFCGYYGGINWWLFYPDDSRSRWARVLRVAQRTQPLLNLLQRGLLRGRSLGSWGSAGLLYIGRKAA